MIMQNEKLYVFGTGNAAVKKCYNTCFAIGNGSDYLMVDAGGGNQILGILDEMNIPLTQIHALIMTHTHTDHILGGIWMVRMIADAMNKGSYEGNFDIYGHRELIDTLYTFCRLTLAGKHFSRLQDRIVLHPVSDGETITILSYPVTFFDIHSTKALQYGFTTILHNKKKLCCTGDEPYNPLCRAYVADSDWLLCEAFCLYGERDRFKPYEKHHSTVKEACLLAQELQIPNLVLWHTEEKNLQRRKELYTAEGKEFYSGNLFVPDDKEILPL